METSKWLKNRASRLIESEAYIEAVPYLERLIKLSGAGPYDLSYAHNMLGEIYLQQGHHRMAQEHIKSAMDISGEDARGLLLLGQALCGDGKMKTGRKVLESALRLKPGNEAIELSLGLCMCQQGQFEEAAEVYERCIRINPERPEAYVGFAQSLAGLGELENAMEVLEKGKERLSLSLTIRLAIKELEKLEKARDFCDWVLEQEFYMPHGRESLLENEPIVMARSAMVEYSFPPQAINNVEKLWHDFLRATDSDPQRPDLWAGAIVYTMARLYGRSDITQVALARKFDCSNGTISNHFAAITRDLKIVRDDKRYVFKENSPQ